MREPFTLNQTFSIEDGMLVRSVAPRRGKPYQHRCALVSLQAIAHAIDEFEDAPFTLESLLDKELNVTFTQGAVALAFIKERGLAFPVHARKHQRATNDTYINTMTEFHALAWKQEHPGEAT